MRLAIVNLTAGGVSGGHKNYLINMLPRLAASAEIKGILLAAPGSMQLGEWLPAQPKVNFAVCEPFSLFHPAPRPAFKAILDSFQPDVVFVPIERHFNYRPAPVVSMVQNMAPLAGFSTTSGIREKIQSMARRFETGRALKRSQAVIVPTEFVRKTVLNCFDVDEEKVSVINFGHNLPTAVKEPSPQIMDGLTPGFIFTAGSFEFYRGFEDLIKALQVLKKTFPGLKLALAGSFRPATIAYRQEIERLAVSLGIAEDILWLGQLSKDELSWFYANCSVFALTSRVESFCFVALEALAHGCNIVSTDSPCLPEILGASARYYAPGDIAGLTQALQLVLHRDVQERGNSGREAVSRAACFSWDETAIKTLDVFRKALGKANT